MFTNISTTIIRVTIRELEKLEELEVYNSISSRASKAYKNINKKKKSISSK